MARTRMGVGLISSLLLVWGGVARAAPPTVHQMLALHPKQQDVTYTTPKPDEEAACKVERVRGAQGLDGWILRDPQGRLLRRFLDTNGDNHLDVWSYYLDGVEVYREIDPSYHPEPNYKPHPDQFRWLNSAGMKWGSALNADGKIDTWKMISTEEASQEILQAVITKDLARLEALWITDADMKALGLPASEVARIHRLKEQAPAKFQTALTKLGDLGEKTRWLHLETAPPHCTPADTIGSRQDLITQNGTILYENNGKTDVIQTGEMVQVGLTWRIIDAPVAGDFPMDKSDMGTRLTPELKRLLEELQQVDANAPGGAQGPANNAAIFQYNLNRAQVLEKILQLKPADRDQWVRQLADCLGAAAQSSPEGDHSAADRLAQLEQQVVREQPGSSLAAYVTFREMSADNARKLIGGGANVTKLQEQWLNRLAQFVQDYPQGEDVPDALMQLGMVSEFVGSEIKAKNWYRQLATNYASHPLATKARGALRRLELEGKTLELSGPLLGSGTFNISTLHGKLVVVYYWASWNQQCVGDFARLKVLLSKYGNQGVELVCINLDNSPPEPDTLRTQGQIPGIQLYQPGGLDSPLATEYGVMVLPNMFLVGKDGKVISRTVQIATLEDEIRKHLK